MSYKMKYGSVAGLFLLFSACSDSNAPPAVDAGTASNLGYYGAAAAGADGDTARVISSGARVLVDPSASNIAGAGYNAVVAGGGDGNAANTLYYLLNALP